MSTEVFVEQLYTKFLFRAPDEAGRNYWISKIESGGLSHAEATYSFALSEEYNQRASSVSQLYFLMFGRVPDSEGMQYWLDDLDRGMGIDDLTNTFMQAQEYQDTYGSAETDAEFLRLLINNGLNRDVDDNDDAWLVNIVETEGRAAVIQSLVSSDEMDLVHGRKIQQTSLYYGVLDRAPTEQELSEAPNEPVELIEALCSDSSYQGEPATLTSLVRITADQLAVNEEDVTVTINITRSGNLDTESSVQYGSYGTTTKDEDYILEGGTAIFAPGEAVEQISLQIRDDDIAEQNEYVTVHIFSPQNTELNYRSNSVEIDIIDNDGRTPIEISSIVESSGATISGTAAGDLLGSVLSAAGDINGDGYDDFIVGSANADHQANYLIFGSSQLKDSVPDLSSLDGTNGVQISGNATRIDAAGDINGDGYDDLILGNPTANETGQAYLVFGKAEGWTSMLSLSDLNGENGVLIDGATAGDYTGFSVAGGGDLNGDGIDDLLIGSPQAPEGYDGYDLRGKVDLIYGHGGGWEATFDLAQLDSSQGVAIVGQTGDALHLGYSVNGVGDMDGDGVDDLMLMAGGFRYLPELHDNGYLIFGRTRGWDSPIYTIDRDTTGAVEITGARALSHGAIQPVGDVNNDGFADTLIGKSVVGPELVFGRQNSDWTTALSRGDSGYTLIEGESQDGPSGDSVAGIGDINQDGFADMLVSGPTDSNHAYLLYGRENGWNTEFNLYEIAEGEGEMIKVGENSNINLAGVGDVNGDGYADFLIGELGLSGNVNNTPGQVHLIFGSDQLFG